MIADKTTIISTAVVITVSVIGGFLLWKYHYSKKNTVKITLKKPEEKYPLKLIGKEKVSHDTYKFKFALPTTEHILGLPTGQHVYISTIIDGKLVARPYTPISSDDDKGFVELMIKIYFRGVNSKFPDGGKMSQHLHSMHIGETIDFRGPSGQIVYKGNGIFQFLHKHGEIRQRHFRKISMIAGGTGITPMLQIISAIAKNPLDRTKVSLLFANQTPNDILCRNELDHLAIIYASRFSIWYTVDRPSETWPYSVGFIDDKMIQERLFPSVENTVVLICGPPPMINFACIPNLDKLAYNPGNRYIF